MTMSSILRKDQEEDGRKDLRRQKGKRSPGKTKAEVKVEE